MGLATGNVLDRYVVEGLLGSGAMGRVYRATDTRLRRAVAIKILEPAAMASGAETAAALQEARAAAAIVHPNVTAVFDADYEGGTSFIVMELVPGMPLRAFVGDETVPLGTRARWLIEIAAALAAAHQVGVVHRDVKPENVIVREDGLIKVLDFGVARFAATSTPALGIPGLSATAPGQTGLAGTPAYMAPEQVQGASVDARADQFAWGVVAYELLTGALPWRLSDGVFGTLASILADQPAPLPSSVPAEIAAVVMRALSKSRGARFATMIEAATALAPFATGPLPLLGLADRQSSELARASSDRESTERARALADRQSAEQPVGWTAEDPYADTLAEARGAHLPPDPALPPAPLERSALRLADEPRALFEPFAPPSNRVAPLAYSIPPPAEPGNEAREAIPPPPSLRTLSSVRESAAPAGPRRSSFDAIAPAPPRDPDVFAPVDLDAHLALLPTGASCKGLFFLDAVRLGTKSRSPGELHQIAGVPERRYIAFRDYPMTDNLRLLVAAARCAHPSVPLGQALRRIGQSAFDTVLGSHVGRTVFGVLDGDVERLLLQWPKAYELFFGFGTVTVETSGPGLFTMRARRFPVFLETYQVGVLEGALRGCRAHGQVRVALGSLADATFEIDLV